MKEHFDFNKVHNRRGTLSIKYDEWEKRGRTIDDVPMWVADMDFPSPPCVCDALSKRSADGFFGYSDADGKYFDTLSKWMGERHQYNVSPNSIVITSGVVTAIFTALQAYTKKGDAVLIQRPVYYPFSHSVLQLERKLVNNPLVYRDGKYEIDFFDFEQKIIENQVKLFILCSPHNPVGRVWRKEELEKIAEICLRHHVYVIADEIHADFIWGKNKHIVFPGISSDLEKITILCTSPGKTFNIPGLHNANMIIPDDNMRKLFKIALGKSGYSQHNVMGLTACQAAYENGLPWLLDLKKYLEETIVWVRNFLKTQLEDVEMIEPEGTYLLWLSFHRTGLSENKIQELMRHTAKVWLDDGLMFGPEGEFFQRVNIAAPREIVQNAFLKIKQAFKTAK